MLWLMKGPMKKCHFRYTGQMTSMQPVPPQSGPYKEENNGDDNKQHQNAVPMLLGSWLSSMGFHYTCCQKVWHVTQNNSSIMELHGISLQVQPYYLLRSTIPRLRIL